MPAAPKWLLTVPDAIAQLAEFERDLLLRRDLERLFGVSKPRAAILMRRFGAERVGNVFTLTRKHLMRQLTALQRGSTFVEETARRERVVTALRRARVERVRIPVTAHTLGMRLRGLPPDVAVEPGRIEVRFTSAQHAVQRLFELAQALTNDYDTFEAMVSAGRDAR